MSAFRRFASLVAVLVFLTSGPLGAWHVASEAVPPPACHPVAAGSAIGDAHGRESVPDGAVCTACHLLQQVRGPVSVTVAFVDARMLAASHLAFDPALVQPAVAGLLPARAPPTPAQS